MKKERRYEMYYSGLSGETEQNTHRCNRRHKDFSGGPVVKTGLKFPVQGAQVWFLLREPASWVVRPKKKERDLYALASEVMEDEKFHDLPCHLQAGIIQSQIKSPRIESYRVQGCWEQGAGWKGREGRRMAQLQNGEREPPFLHFVPFGSSKPRWYLSILGRADRFTPSAEPNINLFQKYPHRRTQK